MSVFASKSFHGHEEVVFCNDPESGLRAIIAVHDTTLGPALGGCRMWPYASEDEALEDVLRLAEGMTWKSSISGLDLGGGKCVVFGDPRSDKTPEKFEALGRFIASLGGRYIVAEDVGTTPRDMQFVARATRHVAGLPEGGVGDPSPATAWGVFHGIRAAVGHKLGRKQDRDDLKGLTVAVQGLGHVGMALCGFLHDAGAELTVADIHDDVVRAAQERFGATAVSAAAVHREKVDVFAPCALGAVIDDTTVPELGAAIVAGSANNQLAEPRHGEMLHRRGVLYAPDYVINAGGIIVITMEGPDYRHDDAFARVAEIGDRLARLFERAERDGIAPHEAAGRIARERVAAARGLRHAAAAE